MQGPLELVIKIDNLQPSIKSDNNFLMNLSPTSTYSRPKGSKVEWGRGRQRRVKFFILNLFLFMKVQRLAGEYITNNKPATKIRH